MSYQIWTVTHQSGATATIYAADEADAIDAYRKNYVQPTGMVTARPQTLQDIRAVDATTRQKARECGLEVLGPSSVATNGIRTLLVCPDGSKEGWKESNTFDVKRATYLEYLNSVRYEDNSSCLSWVALSYGDDDGDAEITSHTWQVPLVE